MTAKTRAFVVQTAIWNEAEYNEFREVVKFRKPGQVETVFVMARSGNDASQRVEKKLDASTGRKVWNVSDFDFEKKIGSKPSIAIRKCFAANGYVF